MTIGERIKNKREELALSQTDLAKRMGLSSRSTICKVEKGNEDNLTTDRIAKFAKALGVTPGYLMGWEDNIDEESGSWAAEYITDKELFDRVTRIQQASPELRNKILSMIDIMLGEE